VTLRADGGARLRLDDELLIDRWGAAAVTESLTVDVSGGAHVVRLEYVDNGGAGSLSFDVTPVELVTPSPVVSPSPATRTPTPATPSPPHLPVAVFLPRVDSVARPDTPTPTATATTIPTRLPYMGNDAIDVQRYDIRLVAPELELGDVRARAVVSITARQAIDMVELDIEPSAIGVESVAVDGEDIAFAVEPGAMNENWVSGSRLKVPLPRRLAAGESVAVRVDYEIDHAAYSHAEWYSHGLTTDSSFGTTRHLFSYNFPYYMRWWVPSNDSITDPATFTFELHVPDGMVAAASGRLMEGDYTSGSGLDTDGLRVFKWEQRQPIPTYLVMMAMGEYEVHSGELCYDLDHVTFEPVDCRAAQRRLPMVYYYPKDVGAWAESGDPTGMYAADLRSTLILQSSLFGDYPFDKLGAIYVSGDVHTIEYASLTIASAGPDAIHEMVHNWWGGAMWLEDWGDFWIKEGLTTYFTGYVSEQVGGVNSSRLWPCDSYRLNWPPDIEPRVAIGHGTPSAYNKGAAVIHDLRWRIAETVGLYVWDERVESTFLSVLADLYQTYRFKALGTESLVAFMRANLGWHLRAAGFTVADTEAQASVDAWAARWFVFDERPTPAR
jgi:hypothetical protein